MTDLTQDLLNQRNLDLVLDTLKLGIIVHTPDRIITVFNQEAEKITGYTRAQVLGKDCHDVFGAPFCGGKCSFCAETDRDDLFPTAQPTKEYPLSIVTRTGETRQLEMHVSALLAEDKTLKGVLASFRDVTQTFDLSLKAENLSSFSGIIGRDKVMQDIFRQIRDVALYQYPVHVSGQTGTGKERVACAIHDISSYGSGAFVPVNCGAIPEGIVESELFGHVKGAFSGAIKERKGRFELADKGTLFLDEVAELPLSTQVKLLRFLQEGAFEKVGGEKKVAVDVRIISATNKNLKTEVEKGRFREDLYYRLNVIPIHLPPLKERRQDIPLLAAHFLKQAELESHIRVAELDEQALDLLMDYHWPGNVRELKNVIQFSVVRSRGKRIRPSDLPPEINRASDMTAPSDWTDPAPPPEGRRQGLDVDQVKAAIKKTGGNKSKAARVLCVGRATLYRFMARHPEIQDYARTL